MPQHIDGLKDLLSHHLTSQPYDRQATRPETFDIQNLSMVVQGFEQGEYDMTELRDAFATLAPGFDVDQWVQQQADEGVYSPSAIS